MKDKIKITPVGDVSQATDPNGKITKLLLVYSESIQELEKDNEKINDAIINNSGEFNDQPRIMSYYNSKPKRNTADKIKITTKSDDQIDSVINALKIASEYTKDNKNKYEFVGNIAAKYRTTLDDKNIKMNLYLYKHDSSK